MLCSSTLQRYNYTLPLTLLGQINISPFVCFIHSVHFVLATLCKSQKLFYARSQWEIITCISPWNRKLSNDYIIYHY